MKETVVIKIKSLDKLVDFCKLSERVDGKVDVCELGNNKCVNAKSVLAIMSLNLLKPLMVKIESDDERTINSFIKQLIGGKICVEEER